MKRLIYLCLAGALFVTAACSGSAGGSQGQTFRVGLSDSPQGFDPALATVGGSHQIIDLVYSGLTKLNKDAAPEPDLAESWKVDPSGTKYVFSLRRGVKFQDGVPLTADDVVFTFDRLRDPKTGYSYITQLEDIKKVSASGENKVEFTLFKPMGPLLTFLAFPGNFIVPKHVVTKGKTLTEHPVGTGPFIFESYRPNQELMLKANTDYYVPNEPKVDRLDIKYIADDTERATALLGGSIDFATQINPRDYSRVTSTPGFKGTETEGGHWYWLMTNDKQRPLNNPLVRQAISYAIDREALAKTLFFGRATPIGGGPIPAWSWAYDASTDQIPPQGDVEKAKALLKQAGYANGLQLTATLGSAWPQLVDQGPLLKEMLARAGITLQLSTMENPRYMDLVWAKSQYQLSNMYWLSPLADPDDFMYLNYRCDSPMNPQKYCNKDLDKLLQQARYSANQAERRKLYRQATELINRETPLIPTVNANILNASTTKVNGWEAMRTGMFDSFSTVSLSK
jgi:peptide/nickel transport system substrate-binding protein